LIVLDTHAWLWWLSDPDKLSRRARTAIDASLGSAAVHVSSISAWEVTLLVRKGRLTLRLAADEWIARSEALSFLRFVPLDNRIAVRSNSLPAPIHDDSRPDDRSHGAGPRGLARDERRAPSSLPAGQDNLVGEGGTVRESIKRPTDRLAGTFERGRGASP
jgi:PIN domain nuclease of toxin-antitoxin system